MSKTPYEIRLDLLNLAKEVLLTPIFHSRDALVQEYNSKLNDENRLTLPFPTLPGFPTTKEIIEKAEELKAFVDQP